MKLKLIKGRSYSSGKIKVTADRPFFETADNKLAERLIGSGYFMPVTEPENNNSGAEKEADEIPLEKKTEKQLDKYAAENGIDLTSCKNKTEKLTKIQEALKASGEKESELNFDDEV